MKLNWLKKTIEACAIRQSSTPIRATGVSRFPGSRRPEVVGQCVNDVGLVEPVVHVGEPVIDPILRTTVTHISCCSHHNVVNGVGIKKVLLLLVGRIGDDVVEGGESIVADTKGSIVIDVDGS